MQNVSNFNSASNFSLVRFNEDRPITEKELNELQQIRQDKLRSFSQNLLGEYLFINRGVINLNDNQFTIQNQKVNVQGNILDITSLAINLLVDQTVYLKVWEQEIDSKSTIKQHGNQQTSTEITNNIQDPRLQGVHSATRYQTQFDLATSLEEEQLNIVCIPIATRTSEGLKDLRLFSTLNYNSINKDNATGKYQEVVSKRTNGSVYTKSYLLNKDPQGNYTELKVDYYDSLGTSIVQTERFRLGYDLDGELISKELI